MSRSQTKLLTNISDGNFGGQGRAGATQKGGGGRGDGLQEEF